MPDDVILRSRDGGAADMSAMAGDVAAESEALKTSPFLELGATGLRRAAGFLDEEFLPQLRGRKGVEVYREMSENDPTVSALLFTIDRLLRNVDWRVEPAGKAREDAKAADFLESCMDDMSQTWGDFISEALSMLRYGWSWHEVVYKRCVGPWERDPARRSKHTDGLVRWRKLPIRAQDTLLRWSFDEFGETRGMVQIAPPIYKTTYLPIERGVLFRYRHYKGNPEGMALADSTPVWTPDGWREHGSLRVGDPVFDESGAIRYVVATARWFDRPRYKVSFNDGTSIIADANHQWLTQSKRERDAGRSGRVRTTEELAGGVKRHGVSNHSIEWAKAVRHPAQSLPVDPWFLGLWLGDGDTNGSRIACHAQDLDETLALIEQCGYPCKHDVNGGSENGRMIKVFGGVQASLGELGVQFAKHIPEAYLRGSVEQRLALLAGLMDSDGTIDRDGRAEFTNTNRSLVDGVAHLVRSLGGQVHVSVRRNATEKTKVNWCVKFTSEIVAFRLERKAARVKPTRVRQRHYVVSVERVEDGPTSCIEVDSPSHLYLAGEGLTPTHNSMLRGAYRPWFFKKRIEEFESIGVERDLAGLPLVKIPAEMLRAKPGSEQAKSVEAFKKLVRSVRRNDQEGMVFPMAYDQETKQPLYSFELLGGGGTRQFNTDAIIQRYDLAILQTVLADFIKVGHEGGGSYSMHVDKTGIFRTALNSITEGLADTMNRHMVPKLFLANGWKPAQLPKIVPDDVDAPDITVLAQFMQQMAAMGITWFPDGDLENFLRGAARLPELDEEALERRRQMQMRSEATQFATANAGYLQAQNQVQAAVMGDAGMGMGGGMGAGPSAGSSQGAPLSQGIQQQGAIGAGPTSPSKDGKGKSKPKGKES